jgi:hypothetical protein
MEKIAVDKKTRTEFEIYKINTTIAVEKSTRLDFHITKIYADVFQEL